MDRSKTPVCIDHLRGEERGHRKRVDHEPLDLDARMNLAWCLFVQAMHQAGGETLLDSLREKGAVADFSAASPRFGGDSRHLLRECLKQMCAVCELSRDPTDLADVERLRYLVTISGAEKALREADDEAARWLAEMAQAIVAGPIVERSVRPRRIPRGYMQ